MFQDPIIEEVRQIRNKIEAECENDAQKYFEYVQQIQDKYRHRTRAQNRNIEKNRREQRKGGSPHEKEQRQSGRKTLPPLQFNVNHRRRRRASNDPTIVVEIRTGC